MNAAGVIPIIFASCLIYFPAQLAALFNVGWLTAFADAISTGWVNWILTVALIVFFAYFYTSMVFNPEETADNLRKQGGFIPGVRPGSATVHVHQERAASRDAAGRHLHRAHRGRADHHLLLHRQPRSSRRSVVRPSSS